MLKIKRSPVSHALHVYHNEGYYGTIWPMTYGTHAYEFYMCIDSDLPVSRLDFKTEKDLVSYLANFRAMLKG